MISLAFQYAASVMVGQQIGAGNVPKALAFKKLVIKLGCGLGLTLGLTHYFSQIGLLQLYTNIPEIQAIILKARLDLAMCIGLNVLMIVLAGVIRGLGVFKRTLLAQFITYYCLCLPLQYFLVFKYEMGLRGIWLGIFLSILILTTYFFWLVQFGVNWTQ